MIYIASETDNAWLIKQGREAMTLNVEEKAYITFTDAKSSTYSGWYRDRREDAPHKIILVLFSNVVEVLSDLRRS